jgi:hypothetical protein
MRSKKASRPHNKLPEKESDIVRAILDFLHYHHIVSFRSNTGAMAGSHTNKQGETNRWYVRFNEPGYPDITGLLKDGKYLAIEVKRHDGKATPDQLRFLQTIIDNHGVAFVARSVDETFDVLKSLGYLKK